MSFGGSAASMIAIIKNNKAILGSRKSHFKRKSELIKASEKLKINYQKASPEELRLVRLKLKRQRFFNRIKTLAIIVLLSPILWFVFSNLWSAIKEKIPKTEREIFTEYYSNIKIGDDYLQKKQFRNAVTFYRRAQKVKGSTFLIDLRLGLASTYECFLKNENCGHAASKIDRIQMQDSTNAEGIKLRKLLFKGYTINNPKDSFIYSTNKRNEDNIFNTFFGK